MEQLSQLRRLGLFDARVPRYTSYPPAPHFADNVSAGDYSRWLAQIPTASAVSIYLHIPFCKRVCWFCACRTQGARSRSEVSSYVDSLIQEIHNLRTALPQGVRAERIFWGGGTPTLLPPKDITRLAKALANAFPHTATAEITVEVDPNEIDGPRMDALAAMGMTRASIGVQDFAPEVQRVIGRDLSFEATHDCVEQLRARGLSTLSMELLFGLPHQNRARIATSAQMLLSLNPDRVALQGYAHVPSIARRQSLIPTDGLPTPEARMQVFEAARQMLIGDGFEAVGIDHFARPSDSLAVAARAGNLRRGFQGYSDDPCEVLLGFGASAISRMPQGYVRNASGTAAYEKAVRGGGFPIAGGHAFAREDALRARLIEMILCDFRVDIARVVAEGLGSRERISAMLDQLARRFDGHVVRTDSGIEIAGHATALSRVIARELDAYAAHTTGNSSAA